jgi:hypothetical protein
LAISSWGVIDGPSSGLAGRLSVRRTLHGRAEFAIVQSYLSTAAKWEISKLDALRNLFNGTPWIPPGLQPAR